MNLDEEFKQNTPRGRQAADGRAQQGSRLGAHSAPPAFKGKSQVSQGGKTMKKLASKKDSLLTVMEGIEISIITSERKAPEVYANIPMVKECTTMVLWQEENLQESQEIQDPVVQSQEDVGGFAADILVLESFLLDDDNERCQIPTDSDIERIREEKEKEEEDSFQEVSHKKKHSEKISEPAVTSRMSLRQREMANVPITKRAEFLTSKKNLELPGTSSNPFAIFQILDNSELNNIAIVSNIVLGSSPEEIDNTIETLKAKEVVQARLAELNWKKELGKKNPQEEEISGEVLLDKSDNEQLLKRVDLTNKRLSDDKSYGRTLREEDNPEPSKRGGLRNHRKK